MLYEKTVINLRVASTFVTRLKGLLGRRVMADNEALWLLRCPAVHTFGMRFDVSICFIDEHCSIVRLYPRVPPGSILWCPGASSVIERVALSTSASSNPCLHPDIEELMLLVRQANSTRSSPAF